MALQHFVSIDPLTRDDIDFLLGRARQLKRERRGTTLAGKSIALIFLNPSLRTRTSFQVGIAELGGNAVLIEPGKGAWDIEFDDHVVMDGSAEEHIAEVAAVLSRYVDAIAIRAFPQTSDIECEIAEPVISALLRHASVPIINMETIVHPLQALAMALTMREHMGTLEQKKFLLTWTYHPRPLNTAVANSALVMAAKLGMEITLLCPSQDYLLHQQFLNLADEAAQEHGGSLQISHDIEKAYDAADFVYAKSWGALPYAGQIEAEQSLREPFRHFIVDEDKMARTGGGLFSHCLPLRRNVKATDAVIDADYCVAIDEAENRLHVQKAVLSELLA